MTPENVAFTGLDLDPRALLQPRKSNRPFVPPHWVRLQFSVPPEGGAIQQIDRWLERRIHGGWSSRLHHRGISCVVVLHFEDPNDAVMFRLMDGETRAFQPDDE